MFAGGSVFAYIIKDNLSIPHNDSHNEGCWLDMRNQRTTNPQKGVLVLTKRVAADGSLLLERGISQPPIFWEAVFGMLGKSVWERISILHKG